MHTVYISDLEDKIVVVPPPSGGLTFVTDSKGLWWHDNSNWEYAPAGDWSIRNAAVDRNNAIGPWSPAVVLSMPLGWKLFGDIRNMPMVDNKQHPDIAAIVWRAERISDGKLIWLVEGQRSGYGAWEYEADPAVTKAPYPWSSSNKGPYGLVMHDRGNAALPVATSTILTFTPGVPNVWLASHKLEQVEVAWAWVTHSGETNLSPSTLLTTIHPAGVTGYRRLLFSSPSELPEAVLGYYLYLKIAGLWRRQVAKPWMVGESDVSKYLYDPADLQPVLWTSCDDTPIHVGGPAWSVSSPISQALYGVTDPVTGVRHDYTHIVVDVPAYTYTPVYDPCRPAPLVGGVPDAQYFNRCVSAPGGGGFAIEQKSTVPVIGDNTPANNHPTYWPLVIESCDELQGTTWHSVSFVPDVSRGPGASCCITARDNVGGQAFKSRWKSPVISPLSRGTFPFIKKGLYIGWENTHQTGGHNASEWEIDSASVWGEYGIDINGTQAVNMVIRGLHVLGIPACSMRFEGCEVFLSFVKAQGYDTLLRCGWIAKVFVDRLFVDRHGHSLVDFESHEPGSIRITSAYLKAVDFLSRSPVATNKHRLHIVDRTHYEPGAKVVSYAVLPDKLISQYDDDIASSISPAILSKLDAKARYTDGIVP